MQGLSAFITAELQARGWSMRQLAERSDLSPAALSRLINDPNVKPDTTTLLKVVWGLEVPFRRLLEACGIHVEEKDVSDHTESAAILESAPDIREFLKDVALLSPAERDYVRAYMQMLTTQK